MVDLTSEEIKWPKMTVTIETDAGEKCTVRGAAVEYHECVELFKAASMGFGYHHQTVEDYFNEVGE